MRHALTLALALAQVGGLQPPQNQQTEPPPGTATIRGHVFASDTGQPLRKAQVRIFAAEIRENRVATTDEQGAYEFTEVRPSRYTISASKGSYVAISYGQVRATDAPKPIEILDRQTVDRLDLSLPHGGVFTGRIVDDFSEPMSEVTVSVQRYQFVQGRRTLVPTGRMSSTNDLGEFRIFGVPPGQYYLVATWRNYAAQNPNAGPGDRLAFPQTFFPGVTDTANAQRFTIGAGQEIADLVMALKPMKAARVLGTATDADGRPLSPAMIMVLRASGMGVDGVGNAQVRPDGSFTVNALPPGDYTLRAQKLGTPGEGPEVAMTTVTVAGEDVTDVHLSANKPTPASGRVIVDPAAAPQLPKTLSLGFFPASFIGFPMPPPPPVRVNDDFTFEVKAPPGAYRVSLGGFGPPPQGWTIRAVRVNGVDVTDTGIEFKAGRDLEGVEVELSNKTTMVSGLVTDAGDPAKNYTAIVFSQDREKWTGATRYQGAGRPDQDGRFKIPNLPPGDYYIIAADRVEQGQSIDPDFLESIRSRATMFSLMEGETKTVDLKLTTIRP